MNKMTRREGLATIGTTVATVALGANASKAATQVAAAFDQSNIMWNTLDGIKHLWYHVLNVDRDLKVVDLLLKFFTRQITCFAPAANDRLGLIVLKKSL